ncbi:MAG: hypothetical protein ACREIC_12825 [Limisphaerales bacterium]
MLVGLVCSAWREPKPRPPAQYVTFEVANGETVQIHLSQITWQDSAKYDWIIDIAGRPYGLQQVGDCDCSVFIGTLIVTVDFPATAVLTIAFSGLTTVALAFRGVIKLAQHFGTSACAEYGKLTAEQDAAKAAPR